MPVPNMSRTLKGWTKLRQVNLVQQQIVDHKVVLTEEVIFFYVNLQPLRKEELNKKVGEQRSWKWWSIIVKNGRLLKPTDKLVIGNKKFEIQNVSDWSESGFQKYEASEDFT